MAYTQTDVETLEAAIASGAKIVRMDGREFEYHSIAQMMEALKRIRAEVEADAAVAAGTKRRPVVFRARHRSGY